jgi:serine/threonine-protein kinase
LKKPAFDRPRVTPDDAGVVTSESQAEAPTIGHYRIVGTLGVGGMGTVYRAEHVLIGRAVAIKLLLPELTANREIVTRFFNEARATSAIKHPGIVEIFDFGYTEQGHAYIVMELLEGETLGQRIARLGRLTIDDAALLMRDVCGALAAAHDLQIVHRDLKPDNIFLVPDAQQGERTKILDFGIAKLTEMGLATGVTKTGAVMGTPAYMSPEQCRGSGGVDGRADLYSIGCILYELIAGRPPFINPGAGELIGSHLFVTPEPLSQHAAVAPELDRLVMSLLEKAPEHRIQSARELAEHLVAIGQLHGDHRVSMRSLTAPAYTPMVTPLKPTTLSGSASETAPHPVATGGRRFGIVIGAALVTLALGGAGLFALRGGDSEPTPSASPPAPIVVDRPVAITPDAAAPAAPPDAELPVDAAASDAPAIDKPKPIKPKADPKKPRPKVDHDLLETDL